MTMEHSSNTARKGLIELNIELNSQNIVSYDPETASLEGSYSDELSAFRAKKIWKNTLESVFLLDDEFDFKLSIKGDISTSSFYLSCKFTTACGRYSFWRLTNNQAPEAQYSLETAHIPNAESLYDLLLTAPDLEKKGKPTRFIEIDESFPEVKYRTHKLVNWIRDLLKNN
jgi:hypothetical protein